MTLYETNEWKAFGKQTYYHNEYVRAGNMVVMYRCIREKCYNGEENGWYSSKKKVRTWSADDPLMPDWLKKKL